MSKLKLCFFETVDDDLIDSVVELNDSIGRLKYNIKHKDVLKNISETRTVHKSILKLIKLKRIGREFPYQIQSEISGIIRTLSKLTEEPTVYKNTDFEDLEKLGIIVIEHDIEVLKYIVLK